MMSLPDCTNSAAVYLSIGVLPASGQRDIEILGLLGQLAMCDQEAQNIRAVIEHNLAFYGINFNGWSGLVRKICFKYGLPDPLQYLQHPWRPDRWRAHCKKIVQDYWDKRLLEATRSMKYFDTEYASTRVPMRVWQLAGLCSASVKQATIVSWMLLGVYFTREFLHVMKKAKSPLCLGCQDDKIENLSHIILHCGYYQCIREEYLPQHLAKNKNLSRILDDEDSLILSILDPLSSKLPEIVTKNWASAKQIYELSREFCYNLHRRRTKLYSELEKES